MKKAVFCALNSKYIHSSLAPWYLRAGVEEFCRTKILTEVIEGTVNEKVSTIVDRIVTAVPDVLSFSVYIWNRTKTFEVIKEVKRLLPNVKVVVGGPEVSYDVTSTLENLCVDFVISGEGEWAISCLLDKLFADGSTFENMAGMSYRSADGRIHLSEPYISYEDPPSPYCDDYLKTLNGRIAYLETSRGCPYNCAYCLSGRCGGVRFFDMERSKEHMLLLANSGAKTVKLVDRTFNADKKRAKEFFAFVIDNYGKRIPTSVCFHFEIAGELLDDETISLLKTAPVGSIQLEIGIQSYNEKTLFHINRKSNTAKLDHNIKRVLGGNNIHVHIDLIAGLPHESFDSFAQGFDRAYRLSADMLQLGFLKLLHGSPMRGDNKYECEYSPIPPYEVISTPYISRRELMRLHCVEHALDRLYNSGRFPRTLRFIFSSKAYTPFEFFENFGNYILAEGASNSSLDEYTNLLFSYLKNDGYLDALELRDVMLLDRIETCATGYIPSALRIEDKNLSRYKKALDRRTIYKSQKGIKRTVVILYTRGTVAYVDYSDKNARNDKHGGYIACEIPLGDLI